MSTSRVSHLRRLEGWRTGEHSRKLVRIVEPRQLLELRDHTAFRVV